MDKKAMHEHLKATRPASRADEEPRNEAEHSLRWLWHLIVTLRSGVPLGFENYPCELSKKVLAELAIRQRDALLYAYAAIAEQTPEYPYELSERDWDDERILRHVGIVD